MIDKKRYKEITTEISETVKIHKTEGKKPQVILLSSNDYNVFCNPDNNEYPYYELKEKKYESEAENVFLYISGFKIIIHECSTIKNRKIEIY